MARPTKETRKRKWHPKLRTGCKTCKIRRKRCDLAQPFCLRCVKGKYKCDGYDPVIPTFPVECSSSKSPSIRSETSQYAVEQSLFPSRGCQTVVQIVREPFDILSTAVDHRYSLFFRQTVAPLLSTTKQWRSFWSRIVLQAGWNYHCLHHAMIALAATYEAKATDVDRTGLIASRVSLAVREFSSQPNSPDVALVLCRLLSAMAKSTGDWKSAVIHLKSGSKIVKEAFHTYSAPSEIATLLAPSLCLTASSDIDLHCLQNMPEDTQRLVTELGDLHTSYGGFLRSLTRDQWMLVDPDLRCYILVSWALITQALLSIAYPNMLKYPVVDGLRSPSEVRNDLLNSGHLLSMVSLRIVTEDLLQELRRYVSQSGCERGTAVTLSRGLQYFAENFLVQAAEVQPAMTVGAFWREGADALCSINCMVRQYRRSKGRTDLVGLGDWGESAQESETRNDHASLPEHQLWYLEYVCPYRSGFIPAFLGPTFAGD